MEKRDEDKRIEKFRKSFYNNLKAKGIKLKSCENCKRKAVRLYKRFKKNTNNKIKVCYHCKDNNLKFDNCRQRNIIIFCKRCNNKFERTGSVKQKLCPECWDKASFRNKFKNKIFSNMVAESRKKGMERMRLLTEFNFQNKSINSLLK